MKLRKGDNIKVISGNDRGKSGKILSVFPDEERVIIEGVNMKKKHVRSRTQQRKGEVVKVPLPIRASRTMLICPHCSKPVRVGFRTENDVKHRVCRACKKDIS